MGLSVVMPVHNGVRFLERAIASIREDAGPHCEIIVVDDRSSDDSRAMAERIARDGPGGIRVVAADKGSPSGARNVGIAAAGGDIIGFLDVDDEWVPGRTAELMRRLDAEPDVDVVYGKVEAVIADRDDPIWANSGFGDQAVPFPLIGTGLYRRRAFERIGTFDEAMRFGEDFDWFLRAGEARLRLLIIDRLVLRYHLHASNMTRDRRSATFAIATVIRRSLLRRRSAGDPRPLPQISEYYETADPG
ncbi:MAG: glycosyltransferase family 2 protein [Alphaproteobacteria bacterium]